MKSHLSKAITDHLLELSDNVSPSDLLIEGTRSKIKTADGVTLLVFNVEDVALVDAETGPARKMLCLIDIMSKKPFEVFDWFMQYLRCIGHADIADEVKTTVDEDVRGSMVTGDMIANNIVIRAIRDYYKLFTPSIQETTDTDPYSLSRSTSHSTSVPIMPRRSLPRSTTTVMC